jgi:outer membrane lipoprotein
MKKIAFMLGAALLFQGCTYAISPDLARQADKNLPFQQIEADPELYKGTLVILGGTIDQIKNVGQDTMLEVVQKPLDHWGRPLHTKQSGGRFLVLSTGYLDTLVYSPGHDITVAAVVQGSRRKGLDEGDYSYPVLLAKELKLWPRENQSWSRPEYLDPLYDPYTSPRQY